MMNAIACLFEICNRPTKKIMTYHLNITYKKLDKFMELNITTQNNLDLFPKKNLDVKRAL